MKIVDTNTGEKIYVGSTEEAVKILESEYIKSEYTDYLLSKIFNEN